MAAGPRDGAGPDDEVVEDNSGEDDHRSDSATTRGTPAALSQHEQVQMALELAEVGIWEFHFHERSIKWSPEVYRIAGRDPATFELTMENTLAIVHADDMERVSVHGMAVLQGEPAELITYRLVRPDGEVRWCENRVRLAADGHLVGIFRDITERRAAELAREADQQRLMLAVEMARLGAWEVDLESGAATWSPEVYRVLGRTPDTIVATAETMANVIHPDDVGLGFEATAAALRGERPAAIEVRFLRPDGEVRWVRLDARLEGPNRLTGFVQDVTEQRAQENAVREQAERLRAIQEHAPIGIGFVALDGRLTEANEAMAAILGRDRASLTELTIADLLMPEDLHKAYEGRQVFRSGEAEMHQVEARFARPDGRTVWALVNTSPLRDRSGAPEGYLAHIVDITERKASEDALRAQAQEVALANRAKTEFLSRMSHELRTPLNAVLGYGQLLEMASLEVEDEEAVQHILRAGRHLLDLIDEVLDITGVEAGTVSLHMEQIDVLSAINDAAQLVQPMAAERRVRIVPPPPAQAGQDSTRPPSVRGDRRRLHQILLNLLSNAIKFNRPGGQVEFAVTSTEGRVHIAVTDTGRGIPTEAMGRVFEPFDRLGAEQLGIQGTGIGLPLARSLAERLDGTLSVSSRPGEGSTFTLTLPAAAEPATDEAGHGAVDAVERVRPAPRVSSVPLSGLPGETLVVVNIEDNPANRQLVEAVVRLRPDVRLHTAADARSGIDLVAEIGPGLVLLDLHLPDRAGLDVLRELCRSEDHRPVIAVLSADASPDRINAAVALGADHYLIKPIDIAELLEVLDDATQRQAASRSGRRSGI